MQIMAFVLKVLPITTIQGRENRASLLQCRRCARNISRKQRSTIPLLSIVSQHNGLTILVNGCTGKMGNAVIEAVASKGIHLVPISFSRSNESGKIVQAGGKEIQLYGPSERESILTSAFEEYPNLMVVDYTVPASVNDNAELYCRVGVPFVMGTTCGDRERLYKTVEDSKVYAVISPQMGKQAMESYQASKLDTSGTAKAIVGSFKKLGVSFELDKIQRIRNPKQQMEIVGVPEEHLSHHAFHLSHLTSPYQTVSLEFQHNVCGSSMSAEGTVDAIIFLSRKVQSKAEKRIYNMTDSSSFFSVTCDVNRPCKSLKRVS
ncbi:hypothetical protein HYC85_012498 [Camellia sinensis]|uniref:Dihydrodipicolinate reductase N-terminal domain-containing protein n=1 Tax=Camellia sinensis TaxID=4442 RepID=A0A7J7HD07_CAMSI|nr:hypothetical protein HYC85_012498 [Camellia sinensis]